MPQMSIVPEGDTLQGALLVPPHAIGFIAPRPACCASVTTVSQAKASDSARAWSKPCRTRCSSRPRSPARSRRKTRPNRVTVRLDRQTIRAKRRRHPVRRQIPSCRADIRLDTKNLFGWAHRTRCGKLGDGRDRPPAGISARPRQPSAGSPVWQWWRGSMAGAWTSIRCAAPIRFRSRA